MSAHKPWKNVITCIVSIAVILFNALVPTVAAAQTNLAKSSENTNSQQPAALLPLKINFNVYTPTPYGTNDVKPIMTIEDGGYTLHLKGNSWKKISLPYSVTPYTVLEFDFMSPVRGDVHGIGWDNDQAISSNLTFKLYGSQSWGISYSSFVSSQVEPGWRHYTIPVGEYYTGSRPYLVFANDNDVANPTAESYFRNVTIREDSSTLLQSPISVSFNNSTISYYAGTPQSPALTMTVEDSGNTLHMVGNGWQRINLPYLVTSSTVMEFDYKSNVQGDVQGIGFDNDLNANSAGFAFNLNGLDNSWGFNAFRYPDYSPEWKHFRIPVGKYYTGEMHYVFFVNDHDTSNPTAENYFRNLSIYEGEMTLPLSIEFDQYAFSPYYSPENDGPPTVSVIDNGDTLHLTGNGWVQISVPVLITPDTMLSFDFKSNAQGDVHGIGFDTNQSSNSDLTFKLYGTQGYGLTTYNDYAAFAPEWKHYDIPVGQYYPGQVLYLFFANDHDVATPTAESYFRNVKISKGPDWATDVFAGSIRNACENKSTTIITATIETDGSFSAVACTQKSCADPINTHTGVFSFTLADLAFPTTAGELVFQRSYSSDIQNTPGVLGYGWTHNHDARLIFPTDPSGMEDYVLFQSVLGNQYLFQIEANGSFTPGPGVIASLTKSGTTPITYTLTTSQQAIFRFNESGRLTERQDAQGHAFDYDYDPQGRLIKVSADDDEHFIEVGYDTQNRITSVSDYADRQVSYVYDVAGDLISVTDVLEQTWTYVYDSEHHMTQSKDPEGIPTTRTEYDSQGRAYRQFDGEDNLIVQIVYNGDGSTSAYDALENVEEHQYNEHNIAVRTTDPLRRMETQTFDENFRPTEIRNSGNQTLQMTWSADGVNLLSKIDPAGNQTDYTYDSLNNLTSVTDARDFPTTYTYDGKLLTKVTDALEGETTYTYTPEGYLESVTDTMDRVTSYIYDEFGRRITMTDPNDKTWHYTYDSLGRLIDTTDPRGRVTHNQYNPAGKLVRVTQNHVPARSQNSENQYNIVTEYEYDVRGNQITVTDTYGHTTRYEYDDADRLVRTIDALGNATVNAYDEAGHLISTTDPLQHTTRYEYDAAGRLVKTINALGYPSGGTTTFNVSTNTSTVTDYWGRSTVFNYDELGRVIKVVDPLGHFTTTAYDPNGNVATRTDQLGRTTYYEYDELNRLVKTIDPNDGETETFYDEAGNRIATEDPLNHRTTYTYDDIGRLIATTDPLQRSVHTEYDVYGHRSASIDAAGHRTEYTYDALDRVIAVTDDDGNTTHTTYDALGNVLSTTDANGNTTYTAYDELNRPLTVTDAEGNTTTNTYDDAGNLVAVKDALDHTTYYTYDELNRQIAITDPLEHTTRSQYDVLGNLSGRVDANGIVTHYDYDRLNRQIAVVLNYKPGVDPDAETNVRYEFVYNEVGNRISVTDPNGHITTYGYDPSNRLIQKEDPLENTWSYEYDLAGNRISATDAKSQTISYTYDVANQLIGINYPGTEADVTFTYDLNGQRIGMIDGLGTTTWTYNDLDRLISVTDAFGQTISYDYDPAGNRTELTYPDDKTVTYSYDDINQLIRVDDWDEQTTEYTYYTYDAVGQLASVSRPNDISSQYTYDSAGRLETLEHTLGPNTLASYSYTYDPAGNRTQAVEGVQNPQMVSISPGGFARVGGQPSSSNRFHSASVDLTALGAPERGGALFLPARQLDSTETPTATPTETATETPTLISSSTETPTETATGTPTLHPSPTETLTATATPLETATDTATATPTETETQTPTVTPTLIPSVPVTIDYTYDALNRLTGATYSDGRNFGYTYDAAGNVLELQQNLGPGTVTTTYTYDDANQLNTAQQGSTSWQYTYDENGSLISDGTKTYAYDSANRLIQVMDQPLVTHLSYNGLGQRLSMDTAGMIAHYVMDRDQPLTAETGDNTTYYLYGLGAIAEKTDSWTYSLPDGTNTPRQLSTSSGAITLSVRYTPWGDTLDTYGMGNFTFGYFGGFMDAATGLLYVGNGQYYDPTTGRFLTRDAKPNQPDPYVPWDPTGGIIAPLGIVALLAGRKKKVSKISTFLMLLLVLGSVEMTLAACNSRDIGIEPTGAPMPLTATLITPTTAKITVGPTTVFVDITPTPEAASELLEYCAELNDKGKVQNIIIFGGSNGQAAITEHGPTFEKQLPKWMTTVDGRPIAEDNLIKYPGYGNSAISGNYLSGKALQAESARNLAVTCDVILIGYSAGTESALMYARWRIQNGQSVRSVVLLGPTFYSYNEAQTPNDISKVLHFGTTPMGANNYLDENTLAYDDWADYISYLLIHRVDVMIWDDDTNIDITDMNNLNVYKDNLPSNSTGTFEYLDRNSYYHYRGSENENATNYSESVKKEVYNWINSH